MDEQCTGEWIDVLMASVGKYMELETSDGLFRQGKITGFRFRDFQFDGHKVLVPTEVEINGDPNDRVPLDRISHIFIQ